MNIDPELLNGRGVKSITEHGQGNAGVPPGNAGAGKPSKQKYKNTHITIDGHTFPSKKEAKRYLILRLMEQNGEIKHLDLQPVYLIVINGMKVCKVIPDFRYRDVNGELVVEDVKSPATRKNAVYRLKKKLLRATHGIEVREI